MSTVRSLASAASRASGLAGWRIAVFPKFLRELTPDELGAALAAAGADEAKLVVRPGYWCERETLARDVPRFVAAMRRHGLGCSFATACYEPRAILAEPALVAVLVEHGVTSFRLAGAPLPEDGDVRGAMRAWKDDVARVGEVCARLGARAVYQAHMDTLFASSTACWWLVDGCDPRHVAVALDPGNQAVEGYEAWDKSFALLGPYLAGLGVKDHARERDPAHAGDPDKGWRWRICPLDEGVTDWQAIARLLVRGGFSGHLNVMPFYHPDDRAAQLATLARDLRYLRAAFAAAVPA